jgi:hypothetical protein
MRKVRLLLIVLALGAASDVAKSDPLLKGVTADNCRLICLTARYQSLSEADKKLLSLCLAKRFCVAGRPKPLVTPRGRNIRPMALFRH